MLVGQEDLLAEARAALAATGRVVLTGPRGIGRSAILSMLAAELTAGGRTVARLAPAPATAYLGLADLLAQVAADAVDTLPSRQADAVDAVLCRGAQQPVDPLALRLGTLALIRQLPGAPVLVVDDVQWLDPASADVIGFVAARAELTMLMARHATAEACAGLDRDAVEFAVPRLTVAQTVELLGRHGLSYRAAVRVHAASGGHPRLALALAAAPRGSARPSGGFTRTGAGAVSRTVEQACRDLLDGATAGVRRLLLLTALAGRLPAHLLHRSGLSARDVASAELAGLVHGEPDDHLCLSADVLAELVIADAGPHEVVAGHRDLADAAPDEPTRLWHVAMTADEPDAALAHALAEACVTVRAQGRPRRAAELALRAVDLAPTGLDRTTVVRWLCDAAQDAGTAGDVPLVRRMLGRLEGVNAPAADRARARLSAFDAAGQDLDGCDELLSTVLSEASGHPGLLAEAHLRLAVRANIAEGSPPRAAVHARRAVQYAVTARHRVAQASSLAYLALMQRVIGDGAAAQTLVEALAVPAAQDWMRITNSPLHVSARHAFFDDRLDDARQELLAMLPSAESVGVPEDQVEVLRALAEVEVRMGRCASALGHVGRAITITERTAMSPGPTWYTAAVVELAAGSPARAAALADAAVRASAEEHDRIYLTRALYARGLTRLAAGDAAGAVESLRAVQELDQQQHARDPSMLRWHGDLAEALVGVGATAAAELLIEQARGLAGAMGHAGVLAALDRADGVLLCAKGGTSAAVETLGRSVAAFTRLGMPLEQARSLLALASVQRRQRRWAASRDTAGLAEAIYRERGGTPWAAARAAQPGPAERTGLNAADARIVEMVAAGAKNREIANALFLSVKTVESSLTRIYRIMGVRSRVQLSMLLAAEAQ
ncbi:LuxR family transcriptional regulator [Catellatospora vulcania]|uniref:LuxR family transcriptional regulator n=1 Tax=Catellatospora vulcania TaxID=1460450 RepID=UPI0012D3F5F5|nr:LuxR family transcriptional regulator [Catellatospora vulcania]